MGERRAMFGRGLTRWASLGELSPKTGAWLQAHGWLVRWLLAGPVALAVAVAGMAAMPLWFPPGAAGVDHLILPLILFPALWSAAFFYACLAENLSRAAFVLLGTLLLNGVAAVWAIWSGG